MTKKLLVAADAADAAAAVAGSMTFRSPHLLAIDVSSSFTSGAHNSENEGLFDPTNFRLSIIFTAYLDFYHKTKTVCIPS